MKNQKRKLLILGEGAVLIAMTVVLSQIRLFKMPFGGSVTLVSMLPLILMSLRWGPKIGSVTAGCYALLNLFLDLASLMSWGMTWWQWLGSLIFDYLLAFTVLGLAGVFRARGLKGALCGVVLSIGLRFVSHVISGTLFFAVWAPEDWNVLLYSVCYNGATLLPECILTAVALSLLLASRQMRKILFRE